MPRPFIAAVTFNHFPVRNTVSGGAEGTGHGAAFTADTVGIIINSKTCFRILAQASCRTGVYAGSVRTVQAGSGQVDAGIAAVRLFYLLVKGFAVAGTAFNVFLYLIRINAVPAARSISFWSMHPIIQAEQAQHLSGLNTKTRFIIQPPGICGYCSAFP